MVMRGRVIARLRRDQMAQEYIDDPQARSGRVSEALLKLPTGRLRKMGARRPSRTNPLQRYEPFALSLPPKALARLEQLGEISFSALVQELLRKENSDVTRS